MTAHRRVIAGVVLENHLRQQRRDGVEHTGIHAVRHKEQQEIQQVMKIAGVGDLIRALAGKTNATN